MGICNSFRGQVVGIRCVTGLKIVHLTFISWPRGNDFMCDRFEDCGHLPFISWPGGQDFMCDWFEYCGHVPFISWSGGLDLMCDWLEDCVHLPFHFVARWSGFVCQNCLGFCMQLCIARTVWYYVCSCASGFAPVPFFVLVRSEFY